MCDFSFNPPSYCLKYKISGEPKRIEKYKPFECEYLIKDYTYIRPPNTYHFDSNLDKISINRYIKTNFKSSKRVTYPEKILSKNCELKEEGRIVVFLSCYDTYESIPDFRILTNGKLMDKVYDPWAQKYIQFDCSKIGSTKE